MFQVTVPAALSVVSTLSPTSWVAAEPMSGHSRYGSLKSNRRGTFRSEGIKFADCCLVPMLEQSFHTVHVAMSISKEAECCQPSLQWQNLDEREGGSCCMSSGLPAHYFKEQRFCRSTSLSQE